MREVGAVAPALVVSWSIAPEFADTVVGTVMNLEFEWGVRSSRSVRGTFCGCARSGRPTTAMPASTSGSSPARVYSAEKCWGSGYRIGDWSFVPQG